MSTIFMEGFGNSIEGRIERLQIMRSDGSIRESKEVNIHNTIVDSGLDNILTIGGFPNGATTNNNVMNWSYTLSTNNDVCRCAQYDAAIWLRMLWFMKLGTDKNNTTTLYDMTDLVEPYINADQETVSQSHYIPATENLNIRGTTHDSFIEGDIHSTHRITSNSVKITEDNVEITEVGFFVGYNDTWQSTAWASQKFNLGDMFCRINLGEHKVTLNAGERLVVTYALTEYAGASTHQAINDINLVDSDGNPIKFTDIEGNEYTAGAIARTWMCDGRQSGDGTVDKKMPGDFRVIYPTEEKGAYIGRAQRSTSYLCTSPIYGQQFNIIDANQYRNNIIYYVFNNNYIACYTNNFLICITEQLYTNNNTYSNTGIRYYNNKDKYGFPNINTTQMYQGSEIFNTNSDNINNLFNAGRCATDDNTNMLPHSNYTGYYWDRYQLISHPTIKGYTRGNHYRDQEWIIPTYCPDRTYNYTGTLQSPAKTFNIYWMNIRNMLYRIGYFTEPGNLDSFVPCPIVKKSGQVLRIVFRERITRHVAGA